MSNDTGVIQEVDPDESASTNENRDISLEIDGLVKKFEENDGSEVIAVDDVSIEIKDGEFIVLVGPSGCGKTTTLRTIAGLEEPTEGRILINDEDMTGLEPRERNIAMVFQNYALYPHKTVRENLAFPLEVRKFSEDYIDEKVTDTAELLDIPELLERHPSDLSGGQQQRVALGRAIVRDPEVFLFDEPLSNLDAKLRIQMRTELNKLHDRVGKTSVYVTHDQAEAMTLGDRIAVMNNGKLQQVDPPQQVYDTPANRFVAGFIGEPPMNFFDADLVNEDGTYRVVGEFFDVALPEPVAANVRRWDGDPESIEIGIRPEHFEDAAHDTREETFDARVKVVEPMGSHVDLALSPDGKEDDDEAEFTARVTDETTAAQGDLVTLTIELESINIFEKGSGENILV